MDLSIAGEEGTQQEISDNNWIWLGRPTSLDAECGSGNGNGSGSGSAGQKRPPPPCRREPCNNKPTKSKSENVKLVQFHYINNNSSKIKLVELIFIHYLLSTVVNQLYKMAKLLLIYYWK